MGLDLKPGRMVGSYKIVRSLGTGGEGDVFLAVGPDSLQVVLKQSRINLADPAEQDNLERVARNRVLVGKRHPAVAEQLGDFVDDGYLYLVSEYCEGQTLDKVQAKRGRLSLAEADPLVRILLPGLGWLHGLGIVHRDIKPENIVVQIVPSGLVAKFIDLGIALHLHRTRLTRHEPPCTPLYASPEAFTGPGAVFDGRSDLYSFGLVVFECLAGRHPYPTHDFAAFFHAMMDDTRPSLHSLVPEAPEALDEWFRRMLAPRPDDRYANADDALAAWRTAVGSVLPSPSPVSPSPKPTPRPKPKPSPAPGLRIESGPLAGTLIALGHGITTVGRADINPDDDHISRTHCSLRLRGRCIQLRDTGSKNGLLVGGSRLRTAVVQTGDTFVLGNTRLKLVG